MVLFTNCSVHDGAVRQKPSGKTHGLDRAPRLVLQCVNRLRFYRREIDQTGTLVKMASYHRTFQDPQNQLRQYIFSLLKRFRQINRIRFTHTRIHRHSHQRSFRSTPGNNLVCYRSTDLDSRFDFYVLDMLFLVWDGIGWCKCRLKVTSDRDLMAKAIFKKLSGKCIVDCYFFLMP